MISKKKKKKKPEGKERNNTLKVLVTRMCMYGSRNGRGHIIIKIVD